MEIESLLPSIPCDPSLECAEPPSTEHEVEKAKVYYSLQSFVRTVLSTIQESPEGSSIYIDGSPEISPSDVFRWGYLWDYIKERALSAEALCEEILRRRIELSEQKEHWRSYVTSHKNTEFTERLVLGLQEGHLALSKEGCGAAYFLFDASDNPLFVIKPTDEDLYCMNNPKHWASPFRGSSFRAREAIPLYRSSQTERLCYLVASSLGMARIVPQTELFVIESTSFYDVSMNLPDAENNTLAHEMGRADFEKLCSVQEYVHDSITMQQQVYEWLGQGRSEQEIKDRLCPIDFEDTNLLLWTSYDTDAHPGNFLFYKKSVADDREPIYGIKKIDNGLAFPEKNTGFVNFLMFFDIKQEPLSARLREKIAKVPTAEILKTMQELEMSTPSMAAFMERMAVMKELAQREQLSIYEMNIRLMLLSQEDGIVKALSDRTIEELEELLGPESREASSEPITLQTTGRDE